MPKPNIYIRSLKDRDVISTVVYSEPLTQRALARLAQGLQRKLDATQHFVDTSEVDIAIAKRRR